MNLLSALFVELRSDNIKLKNRVKCVLPPRIIEVYLTVERLPGAVRHVVGATGKSLLKPPKK